MGNGEWAGHDDMQRTLIEGGLSEVAVPLELRASVKKLGEWFWSTIDVERSQLYFGARRLTEAVGDEDAFALGHVGHGFNSWFLCGLVSYRGRVIYRRAHWGGNVYDTTERQDNNVRVMFASIQYHIDEISFPSEQSPRC